MATNKRQKIVNKVIAAMQLILTANGYETNIGTTVADWRTNWQEADLPAISVCDLTEEVLEEAGGDENLDFYKLPVQIRVYHSTATRAADGRKHIADVLKAIGSNQKWNDGSADLAFFSQISSTGFVMAEDAFRIIGTAVDFNIFYQTTRFDYY